MELQSQSLLTARFWLRNGCHLRKFNRKIVQIQFVGPRRVTVETHRKIQIQFRNLCRAGWIQEKEYEITKCGVVSLWKGYSKVKASRVPCGHLSVALRIKLWLFQTRGRHCYPICQTQSPSLAPILFKALRSLKWCEIRRKSVINPITVYIYGFFLFGLQAKYKIRFLFVYEWKRYSQLWSMKLLCSCRVGDEHIKPTTRMQCSPSESDATVATLKGQRKHNLVG